MSHILFTSASILFLYSIVKASAIFRIAENTNVELYRGDEDGETNVKQLELPAVKIVPQLRIRLQ